MERAKPLPRIVFLSDANDGPECSGPSAVAFYLSHAFPDKLDIRLFNYVKNELYRWDHRDFALGFVACGSIGGRNVYEEVCLAIGCKGYRDSADEDTHTLQLLQAMTRQPPGPQRHFMSRLNGLPGPVGNAAGAALDALLEGRAPESVCFVICPNARNIPAGLLAFSHKLSYSSDGKLKYTDKEFKLHDCAHLKMKKAAAACAVAEIALCQAIIGKPEVRYLGNCYGSQVMWVALGFGLTTFKRHSDVRSTNSAFVNNEQVRIDVRWDDGIFISEPANREQSLTEVLSAEDQVRLFHEPGSYLKVNDLAYNTDYHHSFMMVAPTEETYWFEELSVCKYAWSEALGALVDKGRADFSRKLAQLTSQEGHKYWVGMYSFQRRIFGFQGHPLYHLTEFSSAWNAMRPTHQSGKGAIRNPCYLNNKTIIWDLVFGFSKDEQKKRDKHFRK